MLETKNYFTYNHSKHQGDYLAAMRRELALLRHFDCGQCGAKPDKSMFSKGLDQRAHMSRFHQAILIICIILLKAFALVYQRQ